MAKRKAPSEDSPSDEGPTEQEDESGDSSDKRSESSAEQGEPTSPTSSSSEEEDDPFEAVEDYVEQAPVKKVKAAPVLPWMRVPVAIEAGNNIPLAHVHGMNERLHTALRNAGFSELFPVQAAVWHALAGGAAQSHDLCVCAPTGSGKTLAYVLPVLQMLAGSTARRLQALFVVPTRDLASQVHAVLASLAPAVGCRAGLAAGRTGVSNEAASLWGDLNAVADDWSPNTTCPPDILVATPGRLASHLAEHAHASLAHLRFLVLDETDRLLQQAQQDWLAQVHEALHVQERQNLRTPAACDAAVSAPSCMSRVIKLVVSATLTRDPAKLARLALHHPRYVAMSSEDHRYKLPHLLKEWKVVCPASHKPLMLLTLLRELRSMRVLVFTSSVDTTHRLTLLLRAVGGLDGRVAEFSSHVPVAQRALELERMRAGDAKVAVASDAMTRGMDLPGVGAVINYDAPIYASTYVHRAGRTARAGAEGAVFTLLRAEDVRHFRGMLRKVANNFVKDYRLKDPAALRELGPKVSEGLLAMRAALGKENASQQRAR